MNKFPVLSVLLLVLAGCGDRLADSNLDAVTAELKRADDAGKGLSPKEVESILGPPDRIETFKAPLPSEPKEMEGIRYYYTQHGQTVELHFLDGKLLQGPRHFGPKPTPPPGEDKGEK